MKRHGPWTIKESREAYQGKMFKVFEDEVIRPDGSDGTYTTIRIKPGAETLALDDEGFVYLVKEFRYATGRETIECVGGGIDEGEEPIEAARRELREEAGIEAEEWTELGELHYSTSIVNTPSTLFLARSLKFVEKDPDSGEVIETVKMPFSEAVEKALNGEFIHATTCVLILRAHKAVNSE
ncbi:MAG: NUDIX hydrolase [Acidobacteriota bacterium]|nr:NUDIX hydrolase [Acidobacteriota bacterium]